MTVRMEATLGTILVGVVLFGVPIAKALLALAQALRAHAQIATARAGVTRASRVREVFRLADELGASCATAAAQAIYAVRPRLLAAIADPNSDTAIGPLIEAAEHAAVDLLIDRCKPVVAALGLPSDIVQRHVAAFVQHEVASYGLAKDANGTWIRGARPAAAAPLAMKPTGSA